MARLASAVKKGYYPTPETVIPLIAKYLRISQESEDINNIRILDPCCGEGKAITEFARHLNIPPTSVYGVELDQERFKEAKNLIPNCLFGDSITELNASLNSFSLLYENPPYDDEKIYDNEKVFEDSISMRTEFKFLQAHYKLLTPGGILIYIVPEHILSKPEFVKSIPVWFKNIRIFRFPPEEYKQFKQVVLFGIKKRKVDQKEKENYIRQVNNPLTLGDPCDIVYEIPEPKSKLNSFYTQTLCFEQIKEIYNTPLVQDLIKQYLIPNIQEDSIKSLMPLRLGHMVLLLASGELDGLYRNPQTSELLVIKGTTEIVEHTENFVQETPDGEESITITLKKPISKIYALNITKTLETRELYLEEYH